MRERGIDMQHVIDVVRSPFLSPKRPQIVARFCETPFLFDLAADTQGKHEQYVFTEIVDLLENAASGLSTFVGFFAEITDIVRRL